MSAADVPVRTAIVLGLSLSFVLATGAWWLSDGADGTDPTRIDSCTTITEPGRYALVRDLVDRPASTCIRVESSDVVLDGEGHRIDGRGTFGTAGVIVEPGTGGHSGGSTLSNVTVRNVEVTDWDDGVRFIRVTDGRLASSSTAENRVGITLLNAHRNTLVDNVARSNRLRGIFLVEDSANNTLRNNTAAGNDQFGIHLVEPGVSNNTLVGNTASDNEFGVVLVGARDNVLVGTEASGNHVAGVWLSSSSGNAITGSSVSNRFYGIFLSDRSTDNRVTNTTAVSNPVGVRLRSSDGNAVVGNVIRDSSDTGILLISSDDNRVVDNEGASNARGVVVVRSAGNVVANNSFG